MSGIQLLAATQIEEVLRQQDILTSSLEGRLSMLLQEAEKCASEDKASKNGDSGSSNGKGASGNGGEKSKLDEKSKAKSEDKSKSFTKSVETS
jgi:hypothetical protein